MYDCLHIRSKCGLSWAGVLSLFKNSFLYAPHSPHINGRIGMDNYDNSYLKKKRMGEHKKSLIIAILQSQLDSVRVPKEKMRNSSQLGPCPLPSKTLGTLGPASWRSSYFHVSSFVVPKEGNWGVCAAWDRSGGLNLFPAHWNQKDNFIFQIITVSLYLNSLFFCYYISFKNWVSFLLILWIDQYWSVYMIPLRHAPYFYT